MTVKPFLKWVDGKRSLLPEITKRLPSEFATYREPFLGGGAVFLDIGRHSNGYAYLADANAHLINAWCAVRDNPEDVIAELRIHAERHADEDYYYFVRDKAVADTNEEYAAQFIYMNKTCFNGLYRVNNKGQFNNGRGKQKHPNICDEDTIRAVSAVLQNTVITATDFGNTPVERGDFVYCDPPYDMAINAYTVGGFDRVEHRRLFSVVMEWVEDGANVMLSNANTDYIRRLYSADRFLLHPVKGRRSLGGNIESRQSKSDLLITSYAVECGD